MLILIKNLLTKSFLPNAFELESQWMVVISCILAKLQKVIFLMNSGSRFCSRLMLLNEFFIWTKFPDVGKKWGRENGEKEEMKG